MATGRPDSVLTTVSLVALWQDVVFLALGEADSAVLAVGATVHPADPCGAEFVVHTVLGCVHPLARTLFIDFFKPWAQRREFVYNQLAEPPGFTREMK